MVAFDSSENPVRPGMNRSIGRWLRLIALSLALMALIVVTVLVLIWYHALTSSLAARWIRIHVYHELFAAYVAALVVVPIGLAASTAAGIRARRRGDRRRAIRSGRALLIFLGLMIGLCLCEVVCVWELHKQARLDHPISLATSTEMLQTSGLDDARPLRQAKDMAAERGTVQVVTIGGSSARGVPFHPYLSLDRIITWQLGLAFPNKTFRENNRAELGLTLERAIERLDGLKHRPDMLIIYSGHNEFQSRFGWGRKAPHYRIEPKVSTPSAFRSARAWSYTAEFLGRNADRFETELAPPPRDVRDPADSPCCTPAEYAATLADYRRRLDGLLDDCDAAGILTVVVVPPANDGAFDPNHSILSADTTPDGRRDFIARFDELLRNPPADPGQATARYRQFIAEQPGFAESHYRLAQLLEAAGSYEEAHEEYIKARDLDGIPFRCPTPFLNACREVARRHGSIVVDGPRLLEAASPHGILNDRFFVDAHHPGLNTFVIMARDAVRQLKQRKAFGWPDAVPAPRFSLADCVAHFKLDAAAWIHVCVNARNFYLATRGLPRDSAWRLSVANRYEEAVVLLRAGKGPDETGIPSLKIREELGRDDL